MSDEEYFRSCVAKERHLAQLLGHEVEEYCENAGTLWINTEPVPQWTRDWNAAGALLTHYGIPLSFHKEQGESRSSAVKAGSVIVHFADHPSRERAVMVAIVKAAIHLIEHDKSMKNLHHPLHLPGMHRHH